MTIDAHKLHKSRDHNKDCLIVAMCVANPLLHVLSMIKHPRSDSRRTRGHFTPKQQDYKLV